MRRRDFIIGSGLTGALCVAIPITRGQTPIPVIGCLSSAAPEVGVPQAFLDGLKGAGYVDGKTVAIEIRFAEGHYDHLPALAAELVERKVAAIIAFGPPAAFAAKAATSTIPIVFAIGADPVKIGLVQSLNRPGGNITGTTFFTNMLGPKQLQILHEIVPNATAVGFLVNPGNAAEMAEVTSVETAAKTLGLTLLVAQARNESDLESAFATLTARHIDALVVGSDAYFSNTLSANITSLATSHAIPTVYFDRSFTAAGGLASYGASYAEGWRQAGLYMGRILAGAKPADLPVVQGTKFELAINVKTAKALGLTVPVELLATADEVIE